MNTKGVEDGIVCEFCGTHCYKGAEHNARVEDNARFDDPKPARVEDGISDEPITIHRRVQNEGAESQEKARSHSRFLNTPMNGYRRNCER